MIQEFLTRNIVLFKGTAHRAGNHARIRLLYAPDLRTEVKSLNYDGNTHGVDCCL